MIRIRSTLTKSAIISSWLTVSTLMPAAAQLADTLLMRDIRAHDQVDDPQNLPIDDFLHRCDLVLDTLNYWSNQQHSSDLKMEDRDRYSTLSKRLRDRQLRQITDHLRSLEQQTADKSQLGHIKHLLARLGHAGKDAIQIEPRRRRKFGLPEDSIPAGKDGGVRTISNGGTDGQSDRFPADGSVVYGDGGFIYIPPERDAPPVSLPQKLIESLRVGLSINPKADLLLDRDWDPQNKLADSGLDLLAVARGLVVAPEGQLKAYLSDISVPDRKALYTLARDVNAAGAYRDVGTVASKLSARESAFEIQPGPANVQDILMQLDSKLLSSQQRFLLPYLLYGAGDTPVIVLQKDGKGMAMDSLQDVLERRTNFLNIMSIRTRGLRP